MYNNFDSCQELDPKNFKILPPIQNSLNQGAKTGWVGSSAG
jgi:hypothetical protein